MRLIIRNIDNIPDDVMSGIMSLGFIDTGITTYNTRVGVVAVYREKDRKSRVYTIWKPYSEDVLLDKFKPLE